MQITIAGTYKDATWERIKAERDAAELGGFEYNGDHFDGDADSVRRITGAVVLAILAKQAGQPYQESWTTADNREVLLDADGVIGLGVASGTHVAQVFARGKQLRAAVDAATTADELDAIKWEQA